MSWADPKFLHLFWLLALWCVLYWLIKHKSSMHLGVPSLKLIQLYLSQKTAPRWPRIGKHIPFLLRLFVLAVLILALARPQDGDVEYAGYQESVDIVLAIDTSGSMRALDFAVGKTRTNRLDIIKKVTRSFIKNRPYDRIGLVVFGTHAFTQVPVTWDHGFLEDMLDRVEIGVAGESTAIGNALAMSVKRLRDSQAKSRVIVLLTDGESKEGLDPLLAARLAASLGIKVYTIGIGKNGPVPVPRRDLLGREIITLAELPLNEAVLTQIAQMTEGAYFRATDRKALEKIYEKINHLEMTKMKLPDLRIYHDCYEPFLVSAIFIILLECLLMATRAYVLP